MIMIFEEARQIAFRVVRELIKARIFELVMVIKLECHLFAIVMILRKRSNSIKHH